jgi:hypothetical protein
VQYEQHLGSVTEFHRLSVNPYDLQSDHIAPDGHQAIQIGNPQMHCAKPCLVSDGGGLHDCLQQRGLPKQAANWR